MVKIPTDIQALVFDLGEVLVDVEFRLTEQALNNLKADPKMPLLSFHRQDGFFDAFETGKISAAEFLDRMISYMKEGTEPAELIEAWNAMLLAVPKRKFEILENLRKKYRVYALSNTNSLHIDQLNAMHQSVLANSFDKAYYSFEIGERKPDLAAYLYVLNDINLDPGRCLMIDDRIENLEAAERCGMQVLHLKSREAFYEYFV